MRISAIRSPISENSRTITSGALFALMLACSAPVLGRSKDHSENKEPAKPVTEDTVTVGDVATTPLNDLNITRDEIPPLLQQIQKDPYNHDNLKKCGQIAAAVGELDLVLGDDLDIAGEKSRAVSAGRIAKWAVSRFIPFRGLIREISGAKEHERQFQDAIVAGMMRRSYLKGLGQEKGCEYPARPADEKTIERIQQEREALAAKSAKKPDDKMEKDQAEGEASRVEKPKKEPAK
jgi:hypothetical protein